MIRLDRAKLKRHHKSDKVLCRTGKFRFELDNEKALVKLLYFKYHYDFLMVFLLFGIIFLLLTFLSKLEIRKEWFEKKELQRDRCKPSGQPGELGEPGLLPSWDTERCTQSLPRLHQLAAKLLRRARRDGSLKQPHFILRDSGFENMTLYSMIFLRIKK